MLCFRGFEPYSRWVPLTAVHFELRDVAPDSAPSLETVIQLCQGSDGVRLRGLAVYSNLTNGCEPIHDVRSKIQVHKIALVTVVNLKPPCTLQDLAVNAKKAGFFRADIIWR